MCKSISWQWTPLIVEKYKSYLFEMCWALIEHKHLDSGYWPIFLFLQAKMFILKICKHASSAIPLCELNVGPVISIFTDLLKFQIKHCPISLKLGGHLASIENKDNNLLLIYAVIKPLSRTNTWQWTTSVAVQNISCPISLKKVSAGTNSSSRWAWPNLANYRNWAFL